MTFFNLLSTFYQTRKKLVIICAKIGRPVPSDQSLGHAFYDVVWARTLFGEASEFFEVNPCGDKGRLN